MIERKWDKPEVEKAVRILKEAETEKTKAIKNLDKSIYWIVIIVVILGNIAASVMLIPVLLVLKSYTLYAIIALLGVCFGLLFDILVRDMENMANTRKVIAIFYVPILAIINLYIITVITNSLEITLRLNNDQHSLLLVGFTYAISFILPYLHYNFVKNRRFLSMLRNR